MKKTILFLSICFLLFPLITHAQQSDMRIKEESKTVFQPHWFLQIQGGAGHTVGEAKFSDLISPAAAVSAGYQFSPVVGVRIGAGGWQAKGSQVSPRENYDFKYIQGNADLVVSLSSLLAGFNPERICNLYLFGGAGYNYAFDNDEAVAIYDKYAQFRYLWKDNKSFIAGRFGLGADFRLSDKVAINIEGNANALSDKFNSKKAGNADWQFNALVGLNFKLGKTYTKTEPVYYEPTPVAPPQEEKPQKVEEVIPPAVVQPAPVTITKNVFFLINSPKIEEDQLATINELTRFLQEHPQTKVKITGYADKETGNARINLTLSENRAKNVAKALEAKGISSNRVSIDFKGDTERPFTVQEKNRVSICIVE